jgi:hypothetical protein
MLLLQNTNKLVGILIVSIIASVFALSAYTANAQTCIAYATDGSGRCVAYAEPTVVPPILQSGQAVNSGGAVTVETPTDFKSLVALITGILQTLVIFVFALTFLAFMWGVIKGLVIGGDSAEGVESGKKVVTTGIIVLVIMSAVWGILSLLQSSIFGG